MKKYRTLSLFLLYTFLLMACKRKENTRWNIDTTIPIAYGTIAVSDLIPDSLLQADDAGILHFVVSENLTDFDMDSLVTIPDTAFIDFYGNPFFSTPVDSGASVFVVPIGIKETTMNIPSAELVEVISKSGEINYTLKNFVNGEIKATYELPLVTLDGQTVYIEEILPPGSYTNPTIVSGTFDLSHFHFDLTGLEGDNHNIMVNDITVLANEDMTVPSQDTIFKAVMSFTNAKVAYARGYFGQHQLDINDTIDFEAINNIVDGNLNIGAIDVKLKVENYMGIDGQINFESLKAINTNDPLSVVLNNPDLTNTINLARAYDNNGNINPTTFELNLDENNSNVDEFIEVLPNQMQTNIAISINPLGDISLGNDFIYTDQPLQAHLDIDLPLCVTMDALTLVDTLEINANTEVNASGKLTFYLTNYFPFSANITAILLDEKGSQEETLLDNVEISDGGYNINTYENDGIQNSFSVPFDANTLNTINSNSKIALRITLNSSDNNEVKLTPENRMDIKIILQANAEISSN